MKIKINLKKIEKKRVNLIVDYFKKGKVVVYPTDTIYGLGCLATNRKAINKIYKIKKREKKKPLLILVSDLEMLKKYCYASEEQEKFLRKIWFKNFKSHPTLPFAKGGKFGPVTVILKSKGVLPKELTNGADSLAVRLPKNNFLSKIIKAVGAPIVSTSANLSGEKYNDDIKKIGRLFNKKIDLIIDVGKLNNKPSRIIDIVDIKNRKILRK